MGVRVKHGTKTCFCLFVFFAEEKASELAEDLVKHGFINPVCHFTMYLIRRRKETLLY